MQASLKNRRLANLAHNADDAACNGKVLVFLYDDGTVAGVCRAQLDVVCVGVVIFDGSFVIDLGYDDFAAVCGFLLTCKDQIAIKDSCVDHGIALDAECKDVGTASQKIAVDGNSTFQVLHCENGGTCCNSTHDRNFDGVAGCQFLIFVIVGTDDFDTAAQAGRTADVTLLDEGCENGTHAIGRRNFKMVADFAHGWAMGDAARLDGED